MESYIVRIYRRDGRCSSPVRGLVEKVGAVGQDAFGTKEELWDILSGTNQPFGHGAHTSPVRREKRNRKIRSDVKTGTVTGGNDNEIV